MNRYILAAYTVFSLAAVSLPVAAQVSLGVVGGITRDSSSGKPVPEVRIIAHNLERGTDRTAFTDADGAFIFANLEPGSYEVAAAKEGFQKSSAHVEVAASLHAQVELPLQIAADLHGSPEKPDRQLTEMVQQMLARMELLEERIAGMDATIQELKHAAQQGSNSNGAGAEPLVASLTGAAVLHAAVPLPAAPPAPGPMPIPVPPQQPAAPPPAPALPEALQAPDAPPAVDNDTPFAFGDFTWLNGSPRNKDTVLDTKFFTPEVRFDTHFMEDFNQPVDHTIGGATESFRSGEFQLEQISVGGDFHWQDVRGRILTMDGLFASTTARNDGSAGVGQWDVRSAYKYISEGWGGYHWNVNHGLNVDAGIFVSYIGLFSYYNYDNWTYQPSFVSSNTPWFFNGLRVQWFPTNKLKIEPWVINGWQSYNRFNGHRGLGGQILWQPEEWLKVVLNNYGNGTDDLGIPGRSRLHTDDSIEVRYYNHPDATGISKMAFSLTGDAGCEYGAGVTCHGGKAGPKQSFLGWMLYDRAWWGKDKYAVTLGGGMMNNPGRYLTLLPPINGADAISGSPYFTANPGDKSHMWDASATLQWMPKQYITWWLETVFRHSDVPYWTGRGGLTPPGGNNGSPGQFVCSTGAASGTSNLTAAYANCGGPGSVWFPDLRRGQATLSAGVLVKF